MKLTNNIGPTSVGVNTFITIVLLSGLLPGLHAPGQVLLWPPTNLQLELASFFPELLQHGVPIRHELHYPTVKCGVPAFRTGSCVTQ